MINSQTIAKNSLQSLAHLNRQCNLGQKVKHLFAPVDGPFDQMNVDFGLAT